MAHLQISVPDLPHYPGVLAALRRHHLPLESVQYVEIKKKYHSARTWEEKPESSFEMETTAVLQDGQWVPLTLTELIYNG